MLIIINGDNKKEAKHERVRIKKIVLDLRWGNCWFKKGCSLWIWYYPRDGSQFSQVTLTIYICLLAQKKFYPELAKFGPIRGKISAQAHTSAWLEKFLHTLKTISCYAARATTNIDVLDVYKKSFYYHGAMTFNSLPMKIKTLPPKERSRLSPLFILRLFLEHLKSNIVTFYISWFLLICVYI